MRRIPVGDPLLAHAAQIANSAVGPSQNPAAGGVPPSWVIGILVTLLIAVLTAMGAIIKVAYDTANKWQIVLAGNGGTDSGFIGRTEEQFEELTEAQERVYDQLLIQDQLLSEVAYSVHDIVDELEDEDVIEVDVDLDRIRDLQDRRQRNRDED